MSLFDKIQTTASFISEKIKSRPSVGIILGSGLGGLTGLVDKETEIDYAGIPNFPVSTVKGHGGKLVFGKLGGSDVVLMLKAAPTVMLRAFVLTCGGVPESVA